MKNTKLKEICGLFIVDVILIQGGAGFSFENGANLAIYNTFKLVGLQQSDAPMLIGKVVINVDENEEFILIKFEDNLAICVDMRNDAYNGPEAMQLRMPGEPIVIWN